MPDSSRPRRSYLYMPGSNSRALDKGRNLAADGLILDLEDAVAPDKKAIARDQIAAAIREGGYGHRELVLRVNAIDTEWGQDDLAMAATMGADAVLLPKIDNAKMVLEAQSILVDNGAPESLMIWCMMETLLGILQAKEIAFASPRVGGLVLGTSDLAKDLRCKHTPDRTPFITSLSLCILAARAAGIAVLDGVHLDLNDDEGFAASCQQGVELGFDGKTLIHPKTIDATNTIFSPSEEDIAWSQKIIQAHAEAAASGQGVVVVDGKLIENLHVAEAQRLVVMAEAIAATQI